MRIGFIYDFLYPFTIGGGEYRYWSLATQLVKKHQVTFYSFKYWKSNDELCLTGCEYRSVGKPVAAYSLNGRRKLWEVICFTVGIIKPLWKSRDDIWDIANFPYLSVIVAKVLSLIRKKRLVVTWLEYHGSAFYQLMGWSAWCYLLIEKFAAFCSPHIITNSPLTKRKLLSAGISPKKIDIIPCGIDTRLIESAPCDASVFDLIYTGRLEPHKRVTLLVNALKLLHDRGKKMSACIIGEGSQEQLLKQLVRNLGLHEYVIFFPFFVSPVAMYSKLKSAKILVQPSEREGFGITVVEGWVCGLPAVVCQEENSALPDLIDNEYKGRVVRSDAAAIAQACLELLQNEKDFYRDRLKEFASKFDLLPVSKQLMEYYDQHTK